MIGPAVQHVVASVAGLMLASAATVALALVTHGPSDPSWLPAALALPVIALWAMVGTLRHGGVVGLASSLPALALVPNGTWWLLGALSAGGLALALLSRGAGNPARERDLRQLRNRLRDAEHERQLLHRHLRRYPVLLDACLELSSARNLEQLAGSLCQSAIRLVGRPEQVMVFFASAGEPVCMASSGADGAPCGGVASREVRYVAAEARALTYHDGDGCRTLVPLRGDRRRSADGEVVRGVMEVVFKVEDVGDRLALELLNALARLGGLGLASVDLLQQARSLALHDELTGLFGQHEFLRRLDERVALSQRRKKPLGLIMCDMDHLKRFNDRFGHLGGDQALRLVAGAMRRSLPPGAMACRYGGEEFAALIPDADAAILRTWAEAVRVAVAAGHPIDGNPEARVTVSLGTALLAKGEDGRAALARADAACYAAKAGGRNRVQAATESRAPVGTATEITPAIPKASP